MQAKVYSVLFFDSQYTKHVGLFVYCIMHVHGASFSIAFGVLLLPTPAVADVWVR